MTSTRRISRPREVAGLAAWIALALCAGLAGSRWLPGPWYVALAKPAWNPPAWVFGPVWTLLYVTMGVAAWRVWRRDGLAAARVALGLFVLQLVLNGLWSYVFFGAHLLFWGLVEMAALWLAIAATMWAFARHDRTAAWLLGPYLAWVGFAWALNFALWRLNG